MNIFKLALLAMSFISSSSAHADGRLGVCYKCRQSTGVDHYLWSHDGGRCGGLLNVADSERAPANLCDSFAGIYRWSATNDPFEICSTNSSDHTAWIGGENMDLIALGVDAEKFNESDFYRIQDGEEYRCGLDFVSGRNFSILKRGRYRDVIDLWVHEGDGSFRHEVDRLQDGRYHALVAGSNFAAVLYGQKKDILRLYGIRSDGSVDERANLINDGRDHSIQRLSSTDLGITYGNNNDINLRLCFNGQNWMTGYLGVGQPFAASCNTPLGW